MTAQAVLGEGKAGTEAGQTKASGSRGAPVLFPKSKEFGLAVLRAF